MVSLMLVMLGFATDDIMSFNGKYAVDMLNFGPFQYACRVTYTCLKYCIQTNCIQSWKYFGQGLEYAKRTRIDRFLDMSIIIHMLFK